MSAQKGGQENSFKLFLSQLSTSQLSQLLCNAVPFKIFLQYLPSVVSWWIYLPQLKCRSPRCWRNILILHWKRMPLC